MSNKPERKDYRTAYQVAGQTVYTRRSSKGAGLSIQIMTPDDASNMNRGRMGQAAQDFDPAKESGIWTELKVREFEAEQQRRAEMERQYMGAYRAWEKEREQENHIAYMREVRINHYPDVNLYDSTPEYRNACNEYESEIARNLPKFLNNDVRFQYVFTIATGRYLGRLLKGYKMTHQGNEIIPLDINQETGRMKCLLLDAEGLPMTQIELAFETAVRIEKREDNWVYTWQEYGGFGNRESYMALGIESRFESSERVRTLGGEIYFYQTGAELSWGSSHYDTAESRETLNIHNYLLALAELWDANEVYRAK